MKPAHILHLITLFLSSYVSLYQQTRPIMYNKAPQPFYNSWPNRQEVKQNFESTESSKNHSDILWPHLFVLYQTRCYDISKPRANN